MMFEKYTNYIYELGVGFFLQIASFFSTLQLALSKNYGVWGPFYEGPTDLLLKERTSSILIET